MDELRANDSLLDSKRPRYDELWAKGDERLRKEERSPKQLLSEKTIKRLVEGAVGGRSKPGAKVGSLHRAGTAPGGDE